MNTTLISLNMISKYFGKKLVLKDLNLNITKNSTIALLGHNGSGKSTLLKIIAGLSKISAGNIDYAPQLKIAYIPENFPKIDLSPEAFIQSMGLIEGLSLEHITTQSHHLFDAFQMTDMVDVPIKFLSKGTIQKVAVIQALLNSPDILLLDEPLSGQDLHSQKLFIQMVQNLQQQGVATIMSCHERFLVNQLAHTAFELSDHHLVPLDFSAFCEIEYDVMIFESLSEQKITPVIQTLIEHAEWDHNRLKLIVPRNHSDLVLKEMLNHDFKLRVMKGIDQ